MAFNQYREVYFYTTGLTTVGYQLFNPDGTPNGSRISIGITERFDSVYGAFVSFPDDFDGEIRWDTGEDIPIYASEESRITKEIIVINSSISENSSTTPQGSVSIVENTELNQINVQIVNNP